MPLKLAPFQSVLNRFDHSASKSATTHALPECDDPSGHIYQILNKFPDLLIPYLQNSMDLSDVQKDARRTLTLNLTAPQLKNIQANAPPKTAESISI